MEAKKHGIGAAVLALLSTAVAYVPDLAPYAIQKLIPEHTIVFKLAPFIGGCLSALWGTLGLRKGYKQDSLPSGLTKVLDKIPDSITGKKGSEK